MSVFHKQMRSSEGSLKKPPEIFENRTRSVPLVEKPSDIDNKIKEQLAEVLGLGSSDIGFQRLAENAFVATYTPSIAEKSLPPNELLPELLKIFPQKNIKIRSYPDRDSVEIRISGKK